MIIELETLFFTFTQKHNLETQLRFQDSKLFLILSYILKLILFPS